MIKGGMGSNLGIEDGNVDDIAKRFFLQNYTYVDIVNKTLQDDIWIVKVLVTSFGQQSNRILSIESETGKIISCE
jgi:hypothetical protein